MSIYVNIVVMRSFSTYAYHSLPEVLFILHLCGGGGGQHPLCKTDYEIIITTSILHLEDHAWYQNPTVKRDKVILNNSTNSCTLTLLRLPG